jgi:hypothetical protein
MLLQTSFLTGHGCRHLINQKWKLEDGGDNPISNVVFMQTWKNTLYTSTKINCNTNTG